jgi:hypothetical protein
MIPGIDREEEVRISIPGADPDTVKPPPRSDTIFTYDKAAQVYGFTAKNINHRFPGHWLSSGMLRLVGLYGELNFVGTAASGGPRSCRLVLGKNWQSGKKNG